MHRGASPDHVRQGRRLSAAALLLLTLGALFPGTVPERRAPGEGGAAAPPSVAPPRAALDLAQECRGCHTAARTAPTSRFPIGLGVWRDDQCYGCHAEIDEIGRIVRAGAQDRRSLAVPVTRERLLEMEERPLSYLRTPERIEAVTLGIQRIAPERLGAFLRRPSPGRPLAEHPDAMPSFPSVKDAEAEALLAELESGSGDRRRDVEPDRPRAEAIWKTVCIVCHGREGRAGRTPAYLSLFTGDWIFAYVTRPITVTGRTRNMPSFPMDRATAQGLYELFGEERGRLERLLDNRVVELKNAWTADPRPPELPRAAITYLWNRALREGRCVHCHGGDTRASAHFEATPEGLRGYVGRHGGRALWERLETRELEVEAALTAKNPGMPMIGSPLPKDLRALFLRWARAGCPDLDGRAACPPE